MTILALLHAFAPIASLLGLGGAGTLGCVAVGLFNRKLLFVALIAAAVCAVGTFVYSKGVYDDAAAQHAASEAAVNAAIKQADEIRAAAVRSVKRPHVGRRLRDPYARD